ncbi:MAG TPA: VanZ family protein [Casimicrobiaceae bacterium]|nr:VanZ family protein [Casimicrobiaceae bacterium]
MYDETRASRLPHALVALYAIALVYASLQPFGDWLRPLPDTPFWPLANWPLRSTRFDITANVLAYIPFGLFVALVPRRATAVGSMVVALVAGAALSFAMETGQWYLPPRYANIVDFLANTAGALLGGLMGAALTRSPLRKALREARLRLVLPGTIGDVGLALLATWLVAQMNPAIAPFASTFEPEPVGFISTLGEHDVAATLIEAAQSGFQLLGIGLFVALLVRERRYAGGAVLVLVGMALLIKGVSAWLLLKPEVFVSWLSPGALLGVAAGALLLLPANLLPRPAQVAICAIALLTSLFAPVLAPDLLFAAPPLTLYNWRYGHLLNFNGLTRIILVLWPLAAAVWLFVLAGRPAWGHADMMLPRAKPPDPL